MDIICARTGRHFNGVESAKECISIHDRCNLCPYGKGGTTEPVHFITKKLDLLTKQEMAKLIVDIHYHLAKKRRQQKYIVKEPITSISNTGHHNPKLTIPYAKYTKPTASNPFDPKYVGFYKGERKKVRQKQTDFIFYIIIGLILFVLFILYLQWQS